MRAALIVLVALGLVYQISAECANACSGHGVCKNSDQCDCFPNYIGSDCSQRVCPYGLAWVDNPRGDLDHDGLRVSTSVVIDTFTNGKSSTVASSPYPEKVTDWETFNPSAQTGEAHFYSECSNKGLCDRASGLCVCFDGYTGSSCQRTTCPNDCSGHGICRTVKEIAAGNLNSSVAAGSANFPDITGGLNKKQSDNYNGQIFYDGVATATLYRLWDQDSAQSCVCDPGYNGPDCSQRQCPRGDDPLTHRFAECPPPTNSLSGGTGVYSLANPCVNEVQTIEISTSQASATGWFHFLYKDWTRKIWKTDNILIGTSGATCTDSTLPIYTGTSTTAANNVITGITQLLEGIPNGVIQGVKVTDAVSIDGGFDGYTGTVTGDNALHSSNIGYKLHITFTNSGNLEALTLVNSADMQTNLPACNSEKNFEIAQVTAQYDGNKEESECSNRGVCDYDSGLCKCFKGYYGGDCSMQNALAQ